VEAMDKGCMVKEGFNLVQKIKEIEQGVVLELTYKDCDIIITTSKSMFISHETIDVTVKTILQQQGYTNKKGQ
jgi:hypothetical protein